MTGITEQVLGLAAWEHEPRDPATGRWVTFYHGTSDMAAASIGDTGLRPSALGLTLTKDREAAYYHAAGRVRGGEGKRPAIVTVKIPEAELADYVDNPRGRVVSLRKAIPPQHVSVENNPAEPGRPERFRRQAELAGAAWEHEPRDERGRWTETYRTEWNTAYSSGPMPVLYHGTSHSFGEGDLVEPGHETHYAEAYEDDEYLQVVHATPSIEQAWQHADNAAHEHGGVQQVFEVVPTGPVTWGDEAFEEDFESDEDMNRNATRMSRHPFKVVRKLAYQGEPLPFTKKPPPAELETSNVCGNCGCPVELAAWEHELRDRRGRWTDSGMGSPVSGEPKSKADLVRKLDSMIKRSHGPDVIVPLVNAGQSLEHDDWVLARDRLYKAADAADAAMSKPGTKSRSATSYRLLGDMIEEHYTESSALNSRMAAVNKAPAAEVSRWLGGGVEKWDGSDVFIFDQNTDKSVAATMGWHGEFRMSDDTAREVRKALDSAGPIDTGRVEVVGALSVGLHELIHGVEAPLEHAHSLSGRTPRDDEILRLANLVQAIEHTSERTSIASLESINHYRKGGTPEVTEAEMEDLARRGFLMRAGKNYRDDQSWRTTWLESQTAPPEEDSDITQHQNAYKRYRVSRVEEGFTELGTVHHMPQWLESAGIAGRPTTEVSADNPLQIEDKFITKAAYDNQDLFRVLEGEAGVLGGRPGTFDGYNALGNAKWAFYRDPMDKVEITAQLAKAASSYERADYPEMRSKIINFMHKLGVDPSDVRSLTMREYAEQIATHPSRVADNNAWKHYPWETKAAQAWVKFVARFEGLDPDYPGGPGVRRMTELADEVNQQGPAGKVPAMARQIMRAAGVPANAMITPSWPLSNKLENRIEDAWPDSELGDPQKVMNTVWEEIQLWKEAQR